MCYVHVCCVGDGREWRVQLSRAGKREPSAAGRESSPFLLNSMEAKQAGCGEREHPCSVHRLESKQVRCVCACMQAYFGSDHCWYVACTHTFVGRWENSLRYLGRGNAAIVSLLPLLSCHGCNPASPFLPRNWGCRGQRRNG